MPVKRLPASAPRLRKRDIRNPLAILIILAGTALTPVAGQAQGIAPRQSDRAVLNMQEAATLALEYLEFADAAYSPGDRQNIMGFEYKQSLADFLIDNKGSRFFVEAGVFISDFKGAVYQRNNEIIIAFAGTESARDWTTNFQNALYPYSTQYEFAQTIGHITRNFTQKVTFVGHSLGGGLAQEAAYHSGHRGVGFNTAGAGLFRQAFRRDMGDRFISFNVGSDFAVNSGRQHGTEYWLPGSRFATHGIDNLRENLRRHSWADQPRGRTTNWARVNLTRGAAFGVVTNNISNVGNGNTRHMLPSPRMPDTIANDLFVTQDAVRAESQFRLVEGDEAINLQQHGNSIGNLHSPASTRIYTVNNAGREQTIVEKDFVMAAGVNRFYLTGFGSFITTEYPEFVGTQYNDRGMISLHTLGGQIYPLTESVNQSNFIPVQNLPAPLLKAWEQASGSGGATPFRSLQSRSGLPFFARPSIRVAPGGTVTLRIQVLNVGDTLFPSAIAVTDLSAE